MSRLHISEIDAVRPEGIPDDAVVTVFRVPPEAAGMRLDLFVQTQLKRTSRTRTQAIVRRSAFDPSGARVRCNDRVAAEQKILLWREPWDETPVPTEMPLLYEDAYLFAIGKPAGVPVHPTARYHKNTVVKLLEAERPGQAFTLAHRLDRETSGVLLLAKTREADRGIKKQLEARSGVDKRYLAITWGIPKEPRFRVDLPLELDPEARVRVMMRVAREGTGLSATTHFEVLERAHARGRDYALVSCDLETGRQHQIRVHLAAVGCPIVGDKLYGPDPLLFARGADGELSDEDREILELERHALHAAGLSFDHPITKARVAVEAPLPEDMASFWQAVMASS